MTTMVLGYLFFVIDTIYEWIDTISFLLGKRHCSFAVY